MKLTSQIAELAGIHAGDGHLRKNNKGIEISGGIEEKEYYDKTIIPLINQLTNTNNKGKFFLTKRTYGITISNLHLNKILQELGFPKGSKTTTVSVPKVILNSRNKQIKRAFLRGYLDTDGSITFDKRINNKKEFHKTRNYYPRILLAWRAVRGRTGCRSFYDYISGSNHISN